MTEPGPKTPGIGMTESQFFQLIDEFHVLQIFKPNGGKIMLTLPGEGAVESLTASEFKVRAQESIEELEERQKEIEENRFADPLSGKLPTGENRTVEVRYVKRNDQLTRAEELEKSQLLRSVEKAIAWQRLVIGAMNYLQINFKDLQTKIAERGVPLEPGAARPDGIKLRWTRGIKSAALFCLREGLKQSNAGRAPLDICRTFLSAYTIAGEEDYTPEQLSRNMQQIQRLDRTG